MGIVLWLATESGETGLPVGEYILDGPSGILSGETNSIGEPRRTTLSELERRPILGRRGFCSGLCWFCDFDVWEDRGFWRG